jgi:hypothetical protein
MLERNNRSSSVRTVNGSAFPPSALRASGLIEVHLFDSKFQIPDFGFGIWNMEYGIYALNYFLLLQIQYLGFLGAEYTHVFFIPFSFIGGHKGRSMYNVCT